MNASSSDSRKNARLSHFGREELSAEEKEAKKQKYIAENREAILSWNDWVAKNGLPLAKYRQF